MALPVIVVALLAPSAALAAEGTSTYGEKPPTPTTTTTTTTTTTPTTGTSPSKEEATPTTTSKETTPTTTTSPAKETAKTLPFTGFDLRWSFGVGLALMLAGFSIVLVQRRRREDS